ncbi:hypothetical protein SDC9_90361 [bioreactor metagenome]|uniref:Uncharacterized protein n=1 Tax=bioreactor metagenome TaxID=1076179 RepID=A0A645A1K3_9ZZZZ
MHGHRRVAAGCSAIAQLATIVVAPALNRSSDGRRACVLEASTQCSHTAGQALHAHRRTAICRRAVAQLANRVATPALGTPCSSQRTGVIFAHRQRIHAGQALHIHRHRAIYKGVVAQLTMLVIAPTLGSRRCQRTSVKPARCERGHVI